MNYKAIAVGLISAVIGTALVLVSVHLYQDHQSFHAIINWIAQVEANQAKIKP